MRIAKGTFTTFHHVCMIRDSKYVTKDVNCYNSGSLFVAQPLQLVVAWYLSLRLLNWYLGGWQKKGGFTSEGSTFMPRNGRVTGCESCHDPPQAKREWEDGWEKKGKDAKEGRF